MKKFKQKREIIPGQRGQFKMVFATTPHDIPKGAEVLIYRVIGKNGPEVPPALDVVTGTPWKASGSVLVPLEKSSPMDIGHLHPIQEGTFIYLMANEGGYTDPPKLILTGDDLYDLRHDVTDNTCWRVCMATGQIWVCEHGEDCHPDGGSELIWTLCPDPK